MVGAYLLGSISSAIVTARAMHLPDPRTAGSGNPGATNVLRMGGKKAGILTLCGDFFKGFLPVMLARMLHAPDLTLALIALAAFLGHLYPLYFHFKGGKGIATGAGVLWGMSYSLGGVVMLTWGLVFAIWRYSSLAALVAVLVGVALAAWLLPTDQALTCLIIGILTYWRHRHNIARLLKGTESKMLSKR